MGSVVISVDAELGWGFHDVDPPSDRVEAARPGWRRLVDLFEEYEVPATWAVVGHLLLEECDGRHDDHPAGPEWFERERTAWADRPDLRFGRDLVELVETAPVDHDVGCHTFSHVLFGAADTGREVARAELERAVDVGRREGIEYRSFVFPRNAVGHRDVLAEYGFDAYRGIGADDWTAVEKLAGAARPDPDPGLVTPAVDEYGLVNVPASLFLFGFEGRAKRLVSGVFGDPIVKRARAGIAAAGRTDGVFHLWLHPNNLVTEADVARVEAVLERLARARPGVAVETMADVADRIA